MPGTAQCADRSDNGGAEIGTGGGDHPSSEGRRVEPVVDGRDEVLLDGAGPLGRGHGAFKHVEIVLRVPEVGPWSDGLTPVAQPVQRGEQCRGDRAQPHGVGAPLGLVDVDVRPHPAHRPDERQCRAQAVEGEEHLARRGDRGQHGEDGGRHFLERADLSHECVALVGRRQLTLEHQVPHVLERTLLGQLHGVVLAVVVEALLSPYVADFGLRHDDAL